MRLPPLTARKLLLLEACIISASYQEACGAPCTECDEPKERLWGTGEIWRELLSVVNWTPTEHLNKIKDNIRLLVVKWKSIFDRRSIDASTSQMLQLNYICFNWSGWKNGAKETHFSQMCLLGLLFVHIILLLLFLSLQCLITELYNLLFFILFSILI